MRQPEKQEAEQSAGYGERRGISDPESLLAQPASPASEPVDPKREEPAIVHFYQAQGIKPESWLNEERYDWFRRCHAYASSKTNAIPALSQAEPASLYHAFCFFLRELGLDYGDEWLNARNQDSERLDRTPAPAVPSERERFNFAIYERKVELLVETCRRTQGPCFCGAHISMVAAREADDFYAMQDKCITDLETRITQARADSEERDRLRARVEELENALALMVKCADEREAAENKPSPDAAQGQTIAQRLEDAATALDSGDVEEAVRWVLRILRSEERAGLELHDAVRAKRAAAPTIK